MPLSLSVELARQPRRSRLPRRRARLARGEPARRRPRASGAARSTTPATPGLTWPEEYGGQGAPYSAPGDRARGVRARRGAAAHGRDRPRHGRADDHGPRHRGAEARYLAEDPLGRGDLVPGLLRAGRRLRPLRRCARAIDDQRRPLRRQRPEGLVVVRAHRRLLHPRRPQRPRLRAARGPHVPDRRHARARASRCGRCGRSPARRSSTRSSSPTSRCRARTCSARSAAAGRWR